MAAVILLPAIDLRNGRCVRLTRGALESATVYNADPLTQARSFEELGFTWLHLVDLDGAISGSPVNHGIIERLLGAIKIPIQLGGGIRTSHAISRWLTAGATRVVLGTAALRDPKLVRTACKSFPGSIAIAIDARAGRVAVDGWVSHTTISAVDLARRFEDSGVAAIVHTDIDRDGALTGVNIDATLELADAVSLPVIASGGLASIDDIRRLLEPRCSRIAGVIAGRALYDGRLDPREALELIKKTAREAV
jgi:phosphoribosylformimino-5-aminoimidazole carboxamide ribotide isomerase